MYASLAVASLVCHRDVPLATRCLSSLLTYSREPLRLSLHDDGSLTDTDIETLTASLPGARVIRRREADDLMADTLRRHPTCAAFRGRNPFGLKLLDAPLTTDGPVLRYCDTDVLFFRPFQQLFELPDDVDAVFMTDTHDAYTLRSWQLLAHRLRLVSRSNAGLMCFRMSRFDLDRVEWFLKQITPSHLRHFAEQTAWALLAAPLVTRQWDNAQVRFIVRGVPRPAGLVAGHYIGPFRDLLGAVSDDDLAPTSTPPVTLVTQPATTIGALALATREAQRVLRRIVGLR